MQKKAVCLLSGGLDSTVTAYYAHQQGYQLTTLTFDYGQQHTCELDRARKISHFLKVLNHIELQLDLSNIVSTSLLKSSLKNIQYHPLTQIGKEIPSTYVPARNIIFLSLALGLAESTQSDTIFIGVNAVDYSGYPDCRPEFIQKFQEMAVLGTKQGTRGHPIKIFSPLITKTKSEIIKMGKNLNVPFEHTWSCYHGGLKACGQCDSCQLRLKGFLDADLKDPLAYETYPEWYKP